MAKGNPFRFSTKYQDAETDLLYYGSRYYHTTTGRWLSRDRFGHQSNAALYAVLSNDPCSTVDVDGDISLVELLAIIAVAAVDIYGELNTSEWMDDLTFRWFGGREAFIKYTTRRLYEKGELSGKMWEKAVAKDRNKLAINTKNQTVWANAVSLIQASPEYKERTEFVKRRLRQGTATRGFVNIEFKTNSDLVYSIHGAQLHYNLNVATCALQFWIEDTYNFDKNHAWKRLESEGRITPYPVEIMMEPETFDLNAK